MARFDSLTVALLMSQFATAVLLYLCPSCVDRCSFVFPTHRTPAHLSPGLRLPVVEALAQRK